MFPNNPNFKIEKGGASITLLVIGILFVAGGVTVGVLWLKEILPLGETGSKACIAGGSAVGVAFIVSGYFSKAISNCRNGLSCAGINNEHIWGDLKDIYSRTSTPWAPAARSDGLVYKEIATYQITRDNSQATNDHMKCLVDKCSSYSVYTSYSVLGWKKTAVGVDNGVLTVKILTPVKA